MTNQISCFFIHYSCIKPAKKEADPSSRIASFFIMFHLQALLRMLGWRILQGFQSLFHFLKKRCFHRLLREYPTDSLL